MSQAIERQSVGILGGTFDPVHIGHLRTAVELRHLLQLDELRLLPNAQPPHREQPQISGAHRLAMLHLAVADEPGLRVDDRELRREGPSFTVDTLCDLREELGKQTAICLCIGMDSLVNLSTWHEWQSLADLAHIVVAARPGWRLPETGAVADWLEDKLVRNPKELTSAVAGRVLVRELTLLPVSASAIRSDLQTGRSVRYLTPDCVLEYIEQHNLYSFG